MGIFGRKPYESEITVFLRDVLKQKPHLREEQQKGRGLWWDKPQDLDMQKRVALSKVPPSSYAYQKLPTKN